MNNYLAIFLIFIFLSGCQTDPVKPDPDTLGSDIGELNSYRNSASARCSGSSYRYALGSSGAGSFSGSAALSETLLAKGYGAGSLEFAVTSEEKTELASLLGNFTNDQVENLLKRYQECMDSEMAAFYKVKGLSYPKRSNTETDRTINDGVRIKDRHTETSELINRKMPFHIWWDIKRKGNK